MRGEFGFEPRVRKTFPGRAGARREREPAPGARAQIADPGGDLRKNWEAILVILSVSSRRDARKTQKRETFAKVGLKDFFFCEKPHFLNDFF